MQIDPRLAGKYLYFGNLTPVERQFSSGKFVGLALEPQHDREIRHDARDPLPVPDSSVVKVQSQDVFEHIEYDKLPPILDDIYRVLAPSGTFRLSLPDYNSPFLLSRCVFDEAGNVLADLRMGGSVRFDKKTKSRTVEFLGNGNAHVWFPTYPQVTDLIASSRLSECSRIEFYHYFESRDRFTCREIPDPELFVMRAPPNDMRAKGAPISLVVDFIK